MQIYFPSPVYAGEINDREGKRESQGYPLRGLRGKIRGGVLGEVTMKICSRKRLLFPTN